MPIKPENAKRYPKDWRQIRDRIVARAGWKCEECGVPNGKLGGRDDRGNWHNAHPMGERLLGLEWPHPGMEWWCGHNPPKMLRIIRIVLTVAHLDHTPENCADDNLKALCQRCHLRYDHEHHMKNARETRRAGKAVADLFQP
jgi:hypothetical protein